MENCKVKSEKLDIIPYSFIMLAHSISFDCLVTYWYWCVDAHIYIYSKLVSQNDVVSLKTKSIVDASKMTLFWEVDLAKKKYRY